MKAIKRLIPGTFHKVSGGYARQITPETRMFVPDESVFSFDPETGELYGYSPDYEALEAAKAPGVVADKPGEYSYYTEMQRAPIGCDFAADLAYYGKHYYLKPLHDGLPRLRGRGITYNEQTGDYLVTIRAYGKLCNQYKISHEMWFD